MQYQECKCGKCCTWHSGMPPKPCQGCDECQTNFDHAPLQPHEFEDYYLGGNQPNPVKRCKQCYDIERPEK